MNHATSLVHIDQLYFRKGRSKLELEFVIMPEGNHVDKIFQV